jgi:hypothetical protein
MIEDLIIIQYLALIFVAVLILLWIFFEPSARSPKRDKKRIFACGMDIPPEKLNIPSDSYYEYMKRFLRTGYLARLHSGKLSNYISWIIIGAALIMAAMLILW